MCCNHWGSHAYSLCSAKREPLKWAARALQWTEGPFTATRESESEVAQSSPTLCDPMDCSLPGSSVHGIFQARVLEWVTIAFSRGSSPLRNQIQVSRIAGRRFTIWATREAQTKRYPKTNGNASTKPTWNAFKYKMDRPSIRTTKTSGYFFLKSFSPFPYFHHLYQHTFHNTQDRNFWL